MIIREPEQSYFDNPALSRSDVLRFLKGPRHFKVGEERKNSKALTTGSAFHTLVLEPELFDDRFFIVPDGVSLSTKEGKALKSEAAGRKVLRTYDYEMLQAMATNVLTHKAIEKAFKLDYMAEVSIYGKIEGVSMKCRADLYIPKGNVVLDIKTTSSGLSDNDLRRTVNKYRYDMQCAIYVDLVSQEHAGEPIDFLFVWVEKTLPYDVRVTRLDSDTIARARIQLSELLSEYKKCKTVDVWPSKYAEEIGVIYGDLVAGEASEGDAE